MGNTGGCQIDGRAITLQEKQTVILGLLERIGEPLFCPKNDGKLVFELPKEYMADRYKVNVPRVLRAKPEMTYIFSARKDLDLEQVHVPMDKHWSVFIPGHRHTAYKLVKLLLDQPDFAGFMSLLGACRDRIHPTMFAYALCSATMRHPDLRGVRLPPVWEVFPKEYLDAATISKAEKEAALPSTHRQPIVIERDLTGTDLDPEHRVAYWREDLGLNDHHWHWHLAYPTDAMDRDRKGELFYYMHQQMLARYDTERLCNGLARVRRYQNWDKPIEEGYFSKLTSSDSGLLYGTRPHDLTLSNVHRVDYDIDLDIDDMRRWKDRIFEAIHMSYVTTESGQRVDLTEERGIDILGDIVESSDLNPNRFLYGDLHNTGHVLMAFCHDPDGRHKENMAVMGDTRIAVRDPVFFRWHKFIDDIFQEHKVLLPPYTTEQLGFPDIEVTSVEVLTVNRPKNCMVTFWEQRDMDLTRGLDLRPLGRSGSVIVRFSHLQHEPFVYRINVQNKGADVLKGTVRIFMAIQRSETGQKFRLQDQRLMFMEMDKFQHTLQPGDNEIIRRSDESSVTIPFGRTFRDLLTKPSDGASDQYCGCGWPDHLLVSIGSLSGMAFDLCVMVTDFREDQVQLRHGCGGKSCSSTSYCGLRDDKYPDKKPMGFPFDRLPLQGISTIEDYKLGNMHVTEVTVQHEDRTVYHQ